MKTDKVLLQFVLMQIRKLQDYVSRTDEAGFLENEVLQDACVLKIISIGEYTHRLSNILKQDNPQINWAVIKATRNYYVHAYDRINPIRIWETIQNDIPSLNDQLTAILQNES